MHAFLLLLRALSCYLFNGAGKLELFPLSEGPDRDAGPFCRLILIEVFQFEGLWNEWCR